MNAYIEKEKTGIALEEVTRLTLSGHLKNRNDIKKEDVDRAIKELSALGVLLSYSVAKDDDTVSISMRVKTNPRKAGRKKEIPCEYYTALEVIAMMGTHKDAEVMKKVKMKRATYYRTKKKLKESTLYKAIEEDGNLNNPEYLLKDKQLYTAKNGKTYTSGKFA